MKGLKVASFIVGSLGAALLFEVNWKVAVGVMLVFMSYHIDGVVRRHEKGELDD